MTVNEFSGVSSAGRQGGNMYSFARLLVVLSLVTLAWGCEESTVGPEAPGPGMRQVVEAIRCEGALEADGSRSLLHEARFFPDGSVSTTCMVKVGSTQWLGSAEHQWGRTGQPGAVCEVDFQGGYWRFAMVQDHSATIATRVQASRLQEWLMTCE